MKYSTAARRLVCSRRSSRSQSAWCGPAGLRVEPRAQLGVPARVPLVQALELTVLLGLLEAELADVGEQPVSRPTRVGFLRDDDGLVDERTRQREDLLRGQVVGHTHAGCGLQVEPAHEHGRPCPEPLLEGLAEVVGPLETGAQCPVPVVHVEVAQVEHVEALVEAFADLLRRPRSDPRGSELDGQRDAVQVPTQRDDRRRVVRCQHEVGARGDGPVQEQGDGLVVGDRLRRRDVAVGKCQRRHCDDVLAAEPQRSAAREQEPDVRARGSQAHHEVADGRHEVLAVVEHEQRGAVGDMVGERLQLPRPVGGMQAHRLGHGCVEQGGLGQVCQRHDPESSG